MLHIKFYGILTSPFTVLAASIVSNYLFFYSTTISIIFSYRLLVLHIPPQISLKYNPMH